MAHASADFTHAAHPGTATPKQDASSDVYEFITEPSALFALGAEWEALLQRSVRPYLGQTLDWARVSWETVASPRGRRLFCCVARRGGRVGLIWPLVTCHDRWHSIAHPLGSETSEYTTVLVEDCADCEQRIEAAWQALSASCGCDLIALPNVRSDSPLAPVLSRSTKSRLTFPQAAPWVSWATAGSWDSYYRTLSNDRRNGLARKSKRLNAAGEVRFEIITDPLRCRSIVDWMISTKCRWLEKTGLRNEWILTREFQNFLDVSTVVFAPCGHRLVFALTLNNEVIAAELSSVDASRVEWFMGAFDPDYGKYSPGQLLKKECLKWALDRRLDYDLRMGNEPEKLIWSNRLGEAISYVVGVSAWGTIYVVATRLRILIAQRIPPGRRAAAKSALGRLSGLLRRRTKPRRSATS